MSKKALDYSLFSGLMIWGSEYLPDNIFFEINAIRKWAFEKKMLSESEGQFIGKQRLSELHNHFTPKDGLYLLIHLYQNENGDLCYLEYPYFPVKLLIKREKQVDIVYWKVKPTIWDSSGNPINYTEIYFGFWYPGIDAEEFTSMSTSKSIVAKFHDLYKELSTDYETKTLKDGTLDITVDGAIKAKFLRIGRAFDVTLSK